jgi:hypothetical protein
VPFRAGTTPPPQHPDPRRVELLVALAVVLVAAAILARTWAGSPPAHPGVHVTVTSTEFSGWPFTVPAGELGCDRLDDEDVVTFEADGVVYALDAVAQRAHAGADVRLLLRGTDNDAGLDDVGRRGLDLCR